MSQRIRQLAAELNGAQLRRALIIPPSRRSLGLDMSSAYEVAAEHVRRRRGEGQRTVGRKIGFTNRAVWPQLGLDVPIWSYLYENSVSHVDRAGAVSLAGTVAPRLEPEIVFKLAEAWPVDSGDPPAVLGAVEWVAFGFEIADCHFPEWRFAPPDAVADFGLHAALAIGPVTPVAQHAPRSWERLLSTFRVRLLCNGETVADGTGADVLGSPAQALAYLASLLERSPEPLVSGEIVTTGSLTAALPVRPHQRWSLVTSGIDVSTPTVSLTP